MTTVELEWAVMAKARKGEATKVDIVMKTDVKLIRTNAKGIRGMLMKFSPSLKAVETSL